MAAGDAAMAVALADSVLFSLDADAARGNGAPEYELFVEVLVTESP